jgi:hypothetical protein
MASGINSGESTTTTTTTATSLFAILILPQEGMDVVDDEKAAELVPESTNEQLQALIANIAEEQADLRSKIQAEEAKFKRWKVCVAYMCDPLL